MIYDKSDEVIEEPSPSLLYKYQIRLETSMKGSDFIFDCLDFLNYKCLKINLNCGWSNIDPRSNWIKKTTIDPFNDDDKCFQYAATVALNHEKIGKNWKEFQKLKLL